MPNYNYYKTISANLLVTSHDVNFLMGYLKENHHGVSNNNLKLVKIVMLIMSV
jgi:hypothetical protein